MHWRLLIILAMTMLIGACSGTRHAYHAAEGLDEKAKVVAEHYYALVREANDLKDRGVLSGSQLDRAQDLVRGSRPLVIELSHSAEAYAAVQSASNQADLERALNSAAIAISRLVDVIKAVRPSASLQEDEHGPLDHRIDRAA